MGDPLGEKKKDVLLFFGAPTVEELGDLLPQLFEAVVDARELSSEDLERNKILLSPIKRFIAGSSRATNYGADQLARSSKNEWPNWREVPGDSNKTADIDVTELYQGYSDHGIPVFTQSQNNGTSNDSDNSDHRFLEHSIAVWDDATQQNTQQQSFRTSSSFLDSSFTQDSFSSDLSLGNGSPSLTNTQLKRFGKITLTHNLRKLPTAAELSSLNPQTVTTTLIVGIIAIKSPRLVYLRRSYRTMELVEIIVGDETRTGFAITMWLHPTGDRHSDKIRRILQQLKSRQVVMIANVALHVWKNNVYGQSLNHKHTGHKTMIDVLGGRISMELGTRNLREKALRVEDWVARYLAGSPKQKANVETWPKGTSAMKRRRPLEDLELPPDTQ